MSSQIEVDLFANLTKVMVIYLRNFLIFLINSLVII